MTDLAFRPEAAFCFCFGNLAEISHMNPRPHFVWPARLPGLYEEVLNKISTRTQPEKKNYPGASIT